MAGKTVPCGNSSGRTIDKFEAFGLTPKAASCVKAPIIDGKLVATYNFFIFEVLKAWLDPY